MRSLGLVVRRSTHGQRAGRPRDDSDRELRCSGDTTYRVTYLAWTREELGVLWGERDDRLVRRADAGRVRQGCDRRDAARATAGGGAARGPAGRSGHDAAGTRHRRARAFLRLGPRPPPSRRGRRPERGAAPPPAGLPAPPPGPAT